MKLLEALNFTGWAKGFGIAFCVNSDRKHVYFAHSFNPYQPPLQLRMSEMVALPNGMEVFEENDRVYYSVSDPEVRGLNLKEVTGKQIQSFIDLYNDPSMPPVSPVFRGGNINHAASVPVMVRIEGQTEVHPATYLHSLNQWVVGLDFTFKGVISEWWPMPQAGTGIKPKV